MANPRYIYLLGRLRNRQITMEEATELFSIQQQLLANAISTRSAPSTSSEGSVPSQGPSPTASMVFNDDSLALSLLAMGAGAGILAAVVKRAQEGPRKPPG
jgi:hypothetical protein